MFEQKNISVPKLYHLARQTEKILLILGIIGSLGEGVSGPLMTQLFGGTIDDASSSQNVSFNSNAEYDAFFDAFQKQIDKMAKKFIYIGLGMLVANF